MSKPVYVLGTGLSHDGSSCLMRDGEIAVAIEKERITRKKHDGFNDKLTLQYCLQTEGVTWRDIDLLVENNTKNRFELEDQRRRAGREIPDFVPRVNISHHLAHAYSAAGPSPFAEATVVVIDGRGSSLDNCTEILSDALPGDLVSIPPGSRDTFFENVSIYKFDRGRMHAIFKDFSTLISKKPERARLPLAPPSMNHSIGEFYGGVARFVFGRDFQEGKLMGLAPYGNGDAFTETGFTFAGGRAFINYEGLSVLSADLSGKFYERKDLFQMYANLAQWAQKEIEKAIGYVIQHAYTIAPSANLCYAGGVALNAVANRRILNESPFDEVFIQPAAADNGIAIGCCYYGWLEVLKKTKVKHSGASAFGRSYPDSDYVSALARLDGEFEVSAPQDLLPATARRLAEGCVVGWFEGRSEFGPRALGHRSILADPRAAEMRDFINERIKLREDFRPFAPSVTEEDVNKYFNGSYDSPYMLLVMDTRPEWRDRLAAVTHRDGSARVQTVSATSDPVFHQLLKEFERVVGIPILLNTSFNRRGMPIVETPEQAVQFFIESDLQCLVLDRYLISKR